VLEIGLDAVLAVVLAVVLELVLDVGLAVVLDAGLALLALLDVVDELATGCCSRSIRACTSERSDAVGASCRYSSSAEIAAAVRPSRSFALAIASCTRAAVSRCASFAT